MMRRASALCLLTAVASFALEASAVTITGSVTNGTTRTPAKGDTVVLIALAQRMQELSHTTTDSQGHFSIDVPDPGMHLIRVDHEGAPYFQPAPPNTPTVNVQVYDVSAEVPGVTTAANVMRVETDGQGLHVTQSFFIKNDSNPPKTQFSPHSYEFFLPGDAQIEGSAAMAPGGMPVQSSPVPLAEKGRYAFPFPLRPGVTQFQLSYHLPYSSSLSFSQKFAANTDSFVVMMPKSMSFKAADGASFESLNETPGALTFLARNGSVSRPFAFTVSGSGAMPRDTQAEAQGSDTAAAGGGAGDPQQQGSAAANDTRPGGGLGVPIDTPDPLNKYKWWILGAITLVFAIGAGFFLSRQQPEGAADVVAGTGAGSPATQVSSGGGLMASLKDELFSLETDRLQGKISEAEYEQHKQALELVLRRALARG